MAEKITLVLGGARSGKSTYAQQLAAQTGKKVLYLATAQIHDEEMSHRVAVHQASRPVEWETLEASSDLTAALKAKPDLYDVILLDCVTLLLGGAFLGQDENAGEEVFTRQAEVILQDLFLAIKNRPEAWILVSNEVGMGIVPDTLMGRVFRDIQGRANQQLAAKANAVYLLTAGIPLKIK
jgi:adenosylcobinamide kinase/adenosylcobinamide-phosphate guanylyltransferase